MRMRLILAVIAFGLGYAQYLLPQYGIPFETGYWGMFLHIAIDVLLLTTVCILIFSLFKVDETPDGRICYNPDNPYWRIMGYFDFFDSEVSLCRAYWTTAGLVTATAFVMAALSTFLLMVGGFSYIAYDATFNRDQNSAAVLGYLGMAIILIIAITYLCKFFGWLEEKLPWFEYVNITLKIFVFCAITMALPIFFIAINYNISYGAAVLIYLKWLGVIALGTGGAVLLTWTAFKYLPILNNTWVSYIFRSAKRELCPQLVACPIGNNAYGQSVPAD